MDGGWRQRRPRKWAIDLRRWNNNAFFWYTYNKALLEEHHRMYDGLPAATAVVVRPTWTSIFCCYCSSSSERGERCCGWRSSAIWRISSSVEDIVVEAYPFSGCWIGNGEEVFGNACTSFLRCCCSAEADRFWKDLYNKALLLLLTWGRFWKSLYKLHHACCLAQEEVFGRIDCTRFKPTSSEAVSSSLLDYTLWIHRPFPYLHSCDSSFLSLEFCWCRVFTKIQSSEIAEKMSKNHMCMQCLLKESKNLSCFLALLGSKRELQVAWGLITFLSFFLSSLISCLFSLSAIVPLSYTQLSTWVVPVSLFSIHMTSLFPHVLHMNVAVAVVLKLKARLSASVLVDWLLPRSNLHFHKLSSLFCWWYMLLCVCISKFGILFLFLPSF